MTDSGASGHTGIGQGRLRAPAVRGVVCHGPLIRPTVRK